MTTNADERIATLESELAQKSQEIADLYKVIGEKQAELQGSSSKLSEAFESISSLQSRLANVQKVNRALVRAYEQSYRETRQLIAELILNAASQDMTPENARAYIVAAAKAHAEVMQTTSSDLQRVMDDVDPE